MDSCSNFNFKWWDLIIPSTIISKKLCNSHDKTRLFIVSMIRVFIYLVITIYFYHQMKPDDNDVIKLLLNRDKSNGFLKFIFIISLLMLLANIGIMIAIIFKTVLFIDNRQESLLVSSPVVNQTTTLPSVGQPTTLPLVNQPTTTNQSVNSPVNSQPVNSPVNSQPVNTQSVNSITATNQSVNAQPIINRQTSVSQVNPIT